QRTLQRAPRRVDRRRCRLMVTKRTAEIAGRLAAIVCLLLIAAGTAGADTVRVVTDRALIWNSPSGVAVMRSRLHGHVGRWRRRRRPLQLRAEGIPERRRHDGSRTRRRS